MEAEFRTARPLRRDRAPDGGRLRPVERRRALRISLVEGVAAQCHSTLTGLGLGGNAFTFAFALLLGASDVGLGLIAACPQVAMVSQIGSAWLARRFRERKGLVTWCSGFARMLFVVFPFLPFLMPPETALAVFIALWALANVALNVAGNAWTAWMCDLVPRPIRGRYMSGRAAAAGLAGLVVFLAAGFALDAWAGSPPGASPEADARRLAGFIPVFLVSGLTAVASAWLLLRQPEPLPASPAAIPGGLGGSLRAPFSVGPFRRLVLFFAVFSAVNGLGNPFWTPYTLEDLGADYSFLTVLGAVGGLGGLLTLRPWGRLADRFGSRPILVLVVVVTAVHPVYYLIASRGFLAPLYLDAVSSGVMWGGFNLAIFNLLLTVAPREGREMFYAVFASLAGLAMGASSILSGVIVEHLPVLQGMGRTWNGREIVFASVVVLRLACVPLALRLQEPRSGSVRFVALSIFQMFRGRLTPGGIFPAPRPRSAS